MKLFVFLLLVLFSAPAWAQQNFDVTKMPTVSVTGTAEIQVVPDEATFSLRVSKTDKNLQTAKAQNDENPRYPRLSAAKFSLKATKRKSHCITAVELG